MRKYICVVCGNECKTDHSEQDAIDEFKTLFPNEEYLPDETRCCEPCYIKVMDYNEPGKYRYLPYIDKH